MSTAEKAKANIKAKRAKLPTGTEHAIHEANVANFAINVYEPLDDETYVQEKKCHDAASPLVTRFNKKTKKAKKVQVKAKTQKKMMAFRFPEVAPEKVRKQKKSTVEKAKANIKAKRVKLPTGTEHVIHESNVANFAINVYEPIEPEVYVQEKKCHDAASPLVQRFQKVSKSLKKSIKNLTTYKFVKTHNKNTKVAAKTDATKTVAAKTVAAKKQTVHDKIKSLNTFRFLQQNVPEPPIDMPAYEQAQTNLFLDNLSYSEEHNGSNLLETIEQKEEQDQNQEREVLEIDAKPEKNEFLTPTFSNSLTE